MYVQETNFIRLSYDRVTFDVDRASLDRTK